MTDKELIKLLTDYIDEKETEILKDLSTLIEIPSVRGEASPGMPYGEGPYRALIAAKLLLEKCGLKTKEYDNRVISGDMSALPPLEENDVMACPEIGVNALPPLKGDGVMECPGKNASAPPPLKGEVPAHPAEGFSGRKLDILAHMDVVAAGDGWTVTEPFKPLIKDGKIYGRGTSDDKGPAIAALYALRAIKELALPVNAGCRLVLGSDEECGSSDLPSYLESEGEAEMTFTPDSSFPVTNIEKGRFTGKISFTMDCESSGSGDRASFEDFETFSGVTTSDAFSSDDKTSCECADTVNEVSPRRLINFTSGDTSNIVPGQAEAILQGFSEAEIRDVSEKFREKTRGLFTAGTDSADMDSNDNSSISPEFELKIKKISAPDNKVIFENTDNLKDSPYLKVTITGHGAHASTPKQGINAGVILLNILAELNFDNKEFDSRIKKLAKLFPYGDHNGVALGFNINDEISGQTTVSADIFEITEAAGKIEFDARTSLAFERHYEIRKNVNSTIDFGFKKTIASAGLDFIYNFQPAHVVDADSDFVKTLLRSYEDVTRKEGRCMAIGGGTYVHEFKHGVAFGAVGEGTDTHMHGADEFMDIEELKSAAVVFALSIVRLLKD